LGHIENEAVTANNAIMAHCCVVFCTGDSRYKDIYYRNTGKSLHFHKFPTDEKLRREWIVAIRRDEGINFKVCLVLVHD
jgi:hypothetical protein